MKRRAFMSVLAVGPLAACHGRSTERLTGVTMGTTYSVTIPATSNLQARVVLQEQINRTLHAVVDAMSTYDEQSELSEFNLSREITHRPISTELFSVIKTAVRISTQTQGSFDATVGPLVDLWGFGPSLRNPARPAPNQVEQARARVGSDRLILDEQFRTIAKGRPDVQVDLSSIAKGYGVDQIAGLLEAQGIKNYLIDIGGDIRVRAEQPIRQRWRIAVQAPLQLNPYTAATLELDRGALATSGNYRDFFIGGKRRYPHVINPHSGEPVEHPPTSVTVHAASAMRADALATALLVMGPDRGYQFARRHGLSALFVSLANERINQRSTRAMKTMLAG